MIDSMFQQLSRAKFIRLVEASRVLNSTSELGELLNFIISEAAALTDSEAASILLFDPDKRELRFSATSNQPGDEIADVAVPLDNSVAGTVFQSNQPVIIDEVARDPQWYSHVDQTIGFQTSSILGVPLHDASGQPTGVLEALNKREGSFDAQDVETLSTLADLAGVAVERARLLEELRLAYRQLNELDQLKSNFIAIASHELRTPLSIILGYVSFLREEADNAETAFQLDSVLNAAVRLRGLIQDMLNLQYVETGELQLAREPFDLVEVVQRVVTERDETAEAKRQTITLEVHDEPLRVVGDASAFELVLENLLNNAIKFTPTGGRIEIVLEQHGDEAWLEVRDTGVGIPQEELQRIFNRFYQVEHHMRRQFEGLGLGLAVARDLTELQKGRIWARSEPGKGSQFFVALPLPA